MDVGGIFRNLFRLPPRAEGHGQQSTVETTPRVPTPGVYDDTDLAIHSRSGRPSQGQSQSDHLTLNKLPTFRDLEDTGNEKDGGDEEEVRGRHDSGLRRGNSFPSLHNGPNFIFGDMFAMAREMFGEMDRSMREMDEFFNNSNNDNNSSSHFFNFNLPELEGPKSESSDKNQNPDNNIRELVLKPGTPSLPSPKNDWKLHGKIIRETSKGRETITYQRNANGEIEEHKEYIQFQNVGDKSDKWLPNIKDMLNWPTPKK